MDNVDYYTHNLGQNDKMEGRGVFSTTEGRSFDVDCFNN